MRLGVGPMRVSLGAAGGAFESRPDVSIEAASPAIGSAGRVFLAGAHMPIGDAIIGGGSSNRTAPYGITPIPEPSTGARMLGGLTLTGWAAALRRYGRARFG